MRDRPTPTTSTSAARHLISVDVVLLTPYGKQLAVLLQRASERSRERWMLPWGSVSGDDVLRIAAARVAKEAAGVSPALLDQLGAFSDGKRHPAGAEITVGFFGLLPTGTPAPVGGDVAWFALDALPSLTPRQRTIVDDALVAVRGRIDQDPIAFRLLPPTFTLSELQMMYELLLGRRLHKASFRRALHAAWLVEPTDEWRSEGRGRPAQLFRFAPRKRRGSRRGVRFELLGG